MPLLHAIKVKLQCFSYVHACFYVPHIKTYTQLQSTPLTPPPPNFMGVLSSRVMGPAFVHHISHNVKICTLPIQLSMLKSTLHHYVWGLNPIFNREVGGGVSKVSRQNSRDSRPGKVSGIPGISSLGDITNLHCRKLLKRMLHTLGFF